MDSFYFSIINLEHPFYWRKKQHMKYFGKQREQTLKIVQCQWSNSLNKDCPVCKHKLVFKQSATLCNCYIFAHKACVIKKYNEENAGDIKTKLVCQECNQALKVQFERHNFVETKLSFQSYLLLIGLILLIMIDIGAMGFELQLPQINFFRFIAEIIVLFALTATLAFSLLSIVFKSKYILKEVLQTDRNIKISAFDGIITDRPPPDTVQELSNISNDPMVSSQ